MRTLMSVAATTAPSPGWYPDPREPERHLRWWDGSGWTSYVTDVPEPEPEPEAPHPFNDIVADIAAEDLGIEPIEFSWSDPEDLFEVTVAEEEDDEEPRPALEEPTGFSFRARRLEPRPAVEIEIPSLPVYESPLNTISSPVTVRVEVPVRIVEPPAPPAAPVEEAPEAPAAPEEPAAAVAEPPARRRLALTGTGAVAALAATAALASNLLGGGDTEHRAKPAAAILSAADRDCMELWNTTASATAAQLRVTLGQFQGALARVSQVQPLPNTVMQPDSCALTVYDSATGTHAIFAAGIKDQIGYMDVTAYPRASEYGWPTNAKDANVTIKPDGSIRGL